MTPAELHAAIVARVQARLELARAALLWPADVGVAVEAGPDGVPFAAGEAVAALIAANDPKWTIGMCEAALERLDEHRRVEPGTKCEGCTDVLCYAHEHCPWVQCPEVRREAAVWGVEVDGDG